MTEAAFRPKHPIFGVQEFIAPVGQIHRLVHRRRTDETSTDPTILILKEIVETTTLSCEHHEASLFQEIFAKRGMRERISLSRAWLNVMRDCRRGPPRAIVLHAGDLGRLHACATISPDVEPLSCGRWTRVGKLSLGPEVWTTPWLPGGFERGGAVLGYRGSNEIDCGAFLTPRTDAHGCGHLLAQDDRALMQGRDYFAHIAL